MFIRKLPSVSKITNIQVRNIRYNFRPDFDFAQMRGELYPHIDEGADIMIEQLDKTKLEPFPEHRYEFLKPTLARAEAVNRRRGRLAREKVSGLLKFLNIKKRLKSL